MQKGGKSFIECETNETRLREVVSEFANIRMRLEELSLEGGISEY